MKKINEKFNKDRYKYFILNYYKRSEYEKNKNTKNKNSEMRVKKVCDKYGSINSVHDTLHVVV